MEEGDGFSEADHPARMTLEQALERPHNEYIQWCWAWLTLRRNNDPIFEVVFGGGDPLLLGYLQTMWSVRYYRYHLIKMGMEQPNG